MATACCDFYKLLINLHLKYRKLDQGRVYRLKRMLMLMLSERANYERSIAFGRD